MSSIKYLLVMLFSIAVVACGGGGGSSAPATYAISGTITGASGVVAVGLSGTSTASTNAAANGTYSFTGLANGSYTVTPSLSGYAFTPTSTAVTVSGANVTGKDFTATAAATTYSISGSAGLVGATITLSGANTGSLTAGTGGAYTFPGLINGSYTVTPSLTGYTFAPTSASVTISGGDMTATTFVPTAIPVAHTLSGNVSPSLSGVTITVTGGTTNPSPTTTDASGNYSFTGATGLYDGTYTVTPTKTGYTFAPNSTSVTMAGANVTGKNFTGTANSAVTATANGTVTGTWVEGVSITLSGNGQVGTTTTNASGNYSFGNLPSGATYTFTPSLAGYNFNGAQSVSVAAGSSSAVTVPAITDTSAVTSYSVSGTLTNNSSVAGSGTVRVFQSGCLTYNNCQIYGAAHFASIAVNGTSNYTIRGLQSGITYVVKAGIGAVGSGWPNASNPSGTSSAVPINNADATAVNVAIADSSTPAATAPTGLTVSGSPGDSSAFIQYNPALNNNGAEKSTSYNIYYGTDAAATNGAGSPVNIPAQGLNQSMYFMKGLTSGTMYFRMTALVGSTESTPTAVVAASIGGSAPAGTYTVTGTVTCTSCPALSASTPMIVGVYDQTNGIPYFTTIAGAPSSSQAYTITGVPSGTNYYPFAVIDINNNGRVDLGDISNTNGNGTSISVTANRPNTNIALSGASAIVDVGTSFWSNNGSTGSYNANLRLNDGTKRLVGATLFSAPNVAVPADISTYGNDTPNLPITGNPAIGDSYQFVLTFSDGTTENVTANVTGVLDATNLPRTLVVQTTTPGTPTVPLFTWLAPSTPPAAPYTYGVDLNGSNNPTSWYPNNDLLSSQLSAFYNYDNSASGPLVSGSGKHIQLASTSSGCQS